MNDDLMSLSAPGVPLITLDNNVSCDTYLRADGTWTSIDIKLPDEYKDEITKIIREEIGKVFLEMFVNGDLPLTDLAKKHFIDKL